MKGGRGEDSESTVLETTYNSRKEATGGKNLSGENTVCSYVFSDGCFNELTGKAEFGKLKEYISEHKLVNESGTVNISSSKYV